MMETRGQVFDRKNLILYLVIFRIRTVELLLLVKVADVCFKLAMLVVYFFEEFRIFLSHYHALSAYVIWA